MGLWLGHPGLIFVASALSLAAAIGVAVLVSSLGETVRIRMLLNTAITGNDLDLFIVRVITRSFRLAWLSVIVGPVVGIPFFLICRRILRGRAELFAASHAMPLPRRLRWSVLKVTTLLAFWIMLPVFIAGIITWYAKIAIPPACIGVFASYCILYPEHCRVHDLALAKSKSASP